jgi:hypothetical protein
MHRSYPQLLLLAILLCAGMAHGQAVPLFPGVPPTNSLLKAQEKGDQLYQRGDFNRALVIYRDDLAPRGDKFAQYMVGYMYLAGQAVDQNPVRATAWYRLSAERGEEAFVHARDTLLAAMNDAQRIRCNEIYTELRKEMGDIVIVSELIKDDLDSLSPILHSDVAIGPRLMLQSRHPSDVKLLRQMRFNIETRMTYLLDIAARDDSITQEEREKISSLYENVQRDLLALDAIQVKK